VKTIGKRVETSESDW